MSLLSDSPAIDAGAPDPADPSATDQRGLPRILDGNGDGITRIDMGACEYVPAHPVVFGRHVFYNRSSFDGDDAAIATDKVALFPGQTASLENYTSYSRGINGVMVDIAGLAGIPTVEDFEFRVGNNDDPTAWALLEAVPGIDVRHGAGVSASDRVTIVWDDNAVEKQWLQVTVKANENTGLTAPDVFYFGSAIGESGNSATDAKVNAFDMLGARNNQRTFLDDVPVDFRFDYNRDQRVNVFDMLIARNHATHFVNALKLITVPGAKAAASRSAEFDWIHEFEQTPGDVQKRASAETTVDRLLAAWATGEM